MNKSSTNKPYSESCEQNQDAILAVIKPLLADKKHLLEIGSGTGQHAVYFAQRMPHLIWQTSDQESYHHGIKLWLDEAKLSNTPAPIKLEVSNDAWPSLSVDAIFSANAVHIMSWQNVVDFMENAGDLLETNGLLILYGPFNYDGKFTSESNARFERWLKGNNPLSGIRDFEAMDKLANKAGLSLQEDFSMPANNRILCWEKTALCL